MRGSSIATHPTLTAIGSGRVVDVTALHAPAVMLCYAQATQTAAAPVETAIRSRYPDAASLLVAHVIDLRAVPSMFRGVAEGIMRGEFEKASHELEAGHNASDDVVILPDWDGTFVASTGLDDVSKRLGVAVFSGGALVGIVQDEAPAAGVLELLGPLLLDVVPRRGGA